MRYATRNRRKLTFETLMEMPSEPESQAFYTYTEGDDKIEVLNDTFTLVLSRDVRKNSRIAAEMALAIAKENADHDVFYVNTYAGMALMKEAFSKALDKSGMAPLQPPPSPRLEKAGEYIEKAGESSEKAGENWANVGGGKAGESSEKAAGAMEEDVATAPERIEIASREAHALLQARCPDQWMVSPGGKCSVYGKGVTEEDRAWAASLQIIYPNVINNKKDEENEEELDDEEPDHGPSLLPNLFIYDVPLGTWDTTRLRRDIEDRGAEDNHPVVILNSFEFASISRGQREKMVMQLLELRDTLGLTFLIFSHEMKRDLAAGLPGRGPLGIISANAGSVQRLNDPFEHLIRNRKKENSGMYRSKQAGNGTVHEAQMRSSSRARYEPYRKIPVFRTELEKMQWFREQKESPDYHADPWLNETERLGRQLLPLARSRVLQHYYENHKDHVFSKGQEPTEYEIITGTYEAREYEKKYLL